MPIDACQAFSIEYETGYEEGFKAGFEKAMKSINETVGKWIRPELGSGYFDDYGCPEFYTCSICGEISKSEYDFCPNCGKKMA